MDLPATNKKEAEFYNKDDLSILFDKFEQLDEAEFKYKVGIMLTIFSGLRLAELMGLTWDDVNLQDGTLNINKVRMYEPGVGEYVDSPKTKKSVRMISIPVR